MSLGDDFVQDPDDVDVVLEDVVELPTNMNVANPVLPRVSFTITLFGPRVEKDGMGIMIRELAEMSPDGPVQGVLTQTSARMPS